MDDAVDNPGSVFDAELPFDEYNLQFASHQPDFADLSVVAKCELAEYDCLYNSEGKQVFLRAGTKPGSEFENALQTQNDDSAIVRTTYWTNSGRQSSVYTEIRSPHMKTALKTIVPAYKGRNFRYKHIGFNDKPGFLLHFRDELYAYGLGLEHASVPQQHVSMLFGYLQQELADAITSYTLHVLSADCPSIDFANYWTIFKQGDLAYLPEAIGPDGAEAVVRYISAGFDCQCEDTVHRLSHTWTFTGEYIDNKGKSLGKATLTTRIRWYEGVRPLRELPTIPLHLHPESNKIKERLIVRGRKFVALQGLHHRHFTGTAKLLEEAKQSGVFTMFAINSESGAKTVSVDGRVMLDPQHLYETASHGEEPDSLIPIESSFSDEHYLICRGHVGGYSFNEKKWGYFDVNAITEIDFDGSIFTTALMLDGKYKRMLISLIRMESQKAIHSFGDIIRGKGQGLVFLLRGEPGVGKTMTAESIADCCERPLLRLDTECLSRAAESDRWRSGSDSVEESLSQALRLAERWNAIALLDEADAFLETRSQDYRVYNSAAAAFLRALEYFRGVLFLTTNRINSFDPAFKSRIQVAVYYPPLDRTHRHELWQLFLARASTGHRSMEDWQRLTERIASEDLNGRQIRDVVRVAQAAAFAEESVIELSHVQDALEALRMFDSQFEKGRQAAEGYEDCDEALEMLGLQRKRRRA